MNESDDIERVHGIIAKIMHYQHTHPGAVGDFGTMVAAGVITPDEQSFLESYSTDHPSDYQPDPLTERVHEILAKITSYQHAHSGAAVELGTLVAAGALTPDDLLFLESHSIEYKPHAVTDHHAGDMFYIPKSEGCIFIGPMGPPLSKHSARLSEVGEMLERVLRMPGPTDARLFLIEITAVDGAGIAPGFLSFTLRRPEWRSRAGAIKTIAAEHGLTPSQDSPDIQGNYALTFITTADPAILTQIALDLLRRGLGLSDEEPITYSCGALEAPER